MATQITSLSQLDLTLTFTYADYLSWLFPERVELIKGHLRMMPAPSNKHQKLSGNLYYEIARFLKKRPCQVRYAPFDVRLKRTVEDNEVTTVVQPDLCVVCDPKLFDEKGCNGAPDMIIEILSESTSKHDLVTKYELYEEAGVGEYWVVYPYEKVIDVFYLNAGKYFLAKKYIENDLMEVKTLPGLVIDMKDIFEP
jgi:Uma2 family endonuclease